ncbi:MAG: hypothetical protein WAL56_07010 [Candidatus Sulfotelmatobacter sp.]
MKNAARQQGQPSFYRIANELIELYQLQMDALQRDPSAAAQENYHGRRRKINQLRTQMGLHLPHSRPS